MRATHFRVPSRGAYPIVGKVPESDRAYSARNLRRAKDRTKPQNPKYELDPWGRKVRIWRLDGKKHQIGAPAVLYEDGGEEWWINDQLHREDGPAISSPSGEESWYLHGKLHREGGPARKKLYQGLWVYDGIRINPEFMIEWFVDGRLHREDGPAIVRPGGEEWFVDGRLHREDGPAVVTPRDCQWYSRGVLHREDGPAIERMDGVMMWFYNQLLVSEEHYREINPEGWQKWWNRNHVPVYKARRHPRTDIYDKKEQPQ